jgi:hypothetical protein
MYTELTHDRAEDYALMRALRVGAVVVLQPDASKVAKVWATVKGFGAKLILRSWDLDDGRTAQNPAGVYKHLREHPAELGIEHAGRWRVLVNEMRTKAQQGGVEFPPDDALICHLVNEPDTNDLLEQIDAYTVAAVTRARSLGLILGCYNFGTGHPAILDGTGKPDWSPLRRSLALIKQHGMWVFLHEYYNSTGIMQPALNPWHVMRHWMAPLTGLNVAITEWGVEELVNNLLPNHHGYQGRISNGQYGTDFYYYLTHCAPFVAWVNIFASDLSDRVWRTFDPLAARTDLVAAAQRAQAETSLPPGPTVPGTPDIPGEGANPRLIKPCEGVVTQRFGENYQVNIERYGYAGHNGLDFGAAEGTPVGSIADGEVQWVGEDPEYGKYIRIWHPGLRLHSFYAHLSETLVQGGARVKLGEYVGRVGMTGRSTGPHLHFETRMGEQYTYRDVSYGHGKGRANPEAVFALYGIYL